MSRRNLRRGEFFAYLEIAYAHKLARLACTFCPNIAVDVLGHSDNHSKRLVIGFRQATEPPIFEQIQPVIYSHPHVSGVVFNHRGDLIARKTVLLANG